MKKIKLGLLTLLCMSACNTNPLLQESNLEYGAPQFDKIKAEHYLPAFKASIEEAKAEINAIIENPQAPTFENTILALEFSGSKLNTVSGIFYNLKEADTSDEMDTVAEEVTPMLNDFQIFVSMNQALFERVKAIYDQKESLNLDADQLKLLENSYKSFVRGGALLSEEDKTKLGELQEKLSLTQLSYAKNSLASTNAFTLNVQDEKDLAGLPDFFIEQAAQCAKQHNQQGWTFDLSYPMYGPFMKYSENRELRKQMYLAYGTRGATAEFDNTPKVLEIANIRTEIAQLLGFSSYAQYALEERMIKTPAEVNQFLEDLLNPSLPAAKKEVKAITDYARKNGFPEKELQAWDFSYWSEKYKSEFYDFDETELKPYFNLDSCVNAVFNLAGKLYGLSFEAKPELPVYHPDVKVYDVKDRNGRHMALFYADFFPRPSKRSGAWMTEFRGQSIINGKEQRPFISMVTNFTKPTENAPSLITHDELTTLLHEFGHCLHGILSEGRYSSLSTTNVARDFVELPSQIMENWAYEPEFLKSFAKHYITGELIPSEMIDKIVASKNYNSAYFQVRQLSFGLLDMAWNNLSEPINTDVKAYEKKAIEKTNFFPACEQTCTSTAFSHIFTGGYAAGYYSYKWSEVLEADAFSRFKEEGIFNPEVAESFRANILSRGGQVDPAQMFREFRGRDPQVSALLNKLGIK